MPARMLHLLKTEMWAVAPSAMESMASALRQIPPEAWSVDSREPESIKVERYGEIAVLPVKGAMSNDYGWTGYFSGYHPGYKGLREQFDLAMADPTVSTLLFRFNSPGGVVKGGKELVDHMVAAKGKHGKRIYGYVDGTCLSMALWFAGVCDEVVAPATAELGSIGIIATHADWSKWNESRGIAYTYLTAGAYKAVPNEDTPLDEKARAYIQDRLDRLYGLFVESFAQMRGMDPQAIRDTQARVYLAEEAMAVGFLDRIVPNIDHYIEELKEEGRMDPETLKAQHPELFEQVKALGKAEGEQAASSSKSGADEFMALVRMTLGDDAAKKMQTVSALGISAEQMKAMADAGILNFSGNATPDSEKPGGIPAGAVSNAEVLQGLHTATPGAVSASGGLDLAAPGEEPDFMALVDEHVEAKGCAKAEAMRAIQAKYPKAHEKFILDQQK